MTVLLAVLLAAAAFALGWQIKKSRTAEMELARLKDEDERLKGQQRILRIIADDGWMPDVDGYYRFAITKGSEGAESIIKAAEECGLETGWVTCCGKTVTLIYGTEEKMERFGEQLPQITGEIGACVIGAEGHEPQHMNRLFREARTEFEAAEFKGHEPRVILNGERNVQGPLSVEPKEMERRLFLKLINGDFDAGEEVFHRIVSIDHQDYRDLPLLKRKLFCILENSAYLLAFKAGSEEDLSDIAPRLWGRFETSDTALKMEAVGDEFIELMRQQFSPAESANDRVLADIELYMKSHFTDSELSISSMAEEHNILPQQLSRDFKARYAISPSDYLQQLRLERAKQLLRSTRYSNEKIAELSGFGGVKALYRAMNKIENTTPQKFRRSVDALSDSENETR